MHPHSLWHMNPQPHPVTHCSFDKETLICALTPLCKRPDMVNIIDKYHHWNFHFFRFRLNTNSIRIHSLAIFMSVILTQIFLLNWTMIYRFAHQPTMHRKHPIEGLVYILHMILYNNETAYFVAFLCKHLSCYFSSSSSSLMIRHLDILQFIYFWISTTNKKNIVL